MALTRTLQQQVEALANITINGTSTPTWSELEQLLVDGVKDVTNKVISLDKSKKILFSKTEILSSDAGMSVTGDVLSVKRLSSDSTYYPCTQIPASKSGLALKSDSMSYRSQYNPGWYMTGSLIKTAPVASASQNVIVEYVGYDTSITENSIAINYMPEEFWHLVPMYAAIKSLEMKMGDLVISNPDIPLESAPDWADTNTWISVEEDNEMLLARVQEIQAKVADYTAQVQDYTAKGNYELQRVGSEFNRLDARLKFLGGQYQSSFGAMAELPTKSGGSRERA